jgi:uncharacterized protein YeaO (DUF488 family)
MSETKKTIEVARAYDLPKSGKHYRVLVDRLWSRGVKKESLQFDQWAKTLASSDELRQWFDHDPEKWAEFRKRFLREVGEQGRRLGVAPGPRATNLSCWFTPQP